MSDIPGPPGREGAAGREGATGREGRTGPPGTPGEPGRHGAALPPVITRLVVISVAVNVALAVAIGLLAWLGLNRINGTQQQSVDRIHASQVDACRQSNIARLRDVAIWNRLLTLSPAQKAAQDPAARAEVAQLEHLVAVKDHPVNCVALYPPPRG